MRKCTNTEGCVILHFVRIGREILDEFKFFNFSSGHQIFKILYIHETSSMRKPKSSNVVPQRKNFVTSLRKRYGNSDSHHFFYIKVSKMEEKLVTSKSRYFQPT